MWSVACRFWTETPLSSVCATACHSPSSVLSCISALENSDSRAAGGGGEGGKCRGWVGRGVAGSRLAVGKCKHVVQVADPPGCYALPPSMVTFLLTESCACPSRKARKQPHRHCQTHQTVTLSRVGPPPTSPNTVTLLESHTQ